MSNTAGWTDERLQKLKQLWAEGMSITRIGEELNVTRSTVAGKVSRLGLPKRLAPAPDGAPSPRKKSTKAATAAKVDKSKLPLKLALREIDWSRSKCAWPKGDPKTTQFDFCGAVVVPGKPYCNEHCFEAYTTGREGG